MFLSCLCESLSPGRHSNLLCSLGSSHPRAEVGQRKPAWITLEVAQKGFGSSTFPTRRQDGREGREEGVIALEPAEWVLGPKGVGEGHCLSPGQSLGTQCPSSSSAVSQDAFASYLFEAGPALAEAQAGAGVGFDHHLSVLLSLGRVVEPAPHGMAPVRRG